MSRAGRRWWWSVALGALAELAVASPRLSGRVGNETGYFVHPDRERVRHHRYELKLRQDVPYSFQLSTVVEARFRFDAALYDHASSPQRDLPNEVRDNEMVEREPRQIYLDYLGDSYRLTAGLQLIDWVESLSPLANDMLTPLDLRHGGFGDAAENIVPRGAIMVNFKALGGTIELLTVPYAPHSRLPKEENGYGYYELARSLIDDVPLVIKEEKTRYGASETEFGARYLLAAGEWEWTLLAFRGHQTRPSLDIENIQEGRRFDITFKFPMTNTYGTFLTYADGGLVTRFMGFFEPRRAPLYNIVNYDDEPYEKRARVGLGLDYVFSKHLKLYTEQFFTRTETVPRLYAPDSDDDDGDDGEDIVIFGLVQDDPGTDGAEQSADSDNPRKDYVAAFRVANESFQNWVFQLEGVVTSPYKSHMLAPQIEWAFLNDYKAQLGARFVKSFDQQAMFEPLKNASLVYVSLFKYFSVSGGDSY